VTSPLDEYPVHQVPLSMAQVATSDRNFYDRCYFNAHDRTGDVFLVTGLGVYPNLGVIDAYATVRRGDTQWAVRFSDALDPAADRRDQRVGAYRVEVVEPLRRLRLVCDGDGVAGGRLGFDLTWEGSFPPVDEARHTLRSTTRTILDTARFAQLGTWEGVLRVDGEELTVDPAVWLGSRDRSWGIRPVGEPEPPGRGADEPIEGFWWLYVPLRFDDWALVVLAQEDPDGTRTLSDAVRVRADGRRERLGGPEVEVRYRPGTRIPEAATLRLTERGGGRTTVEIEPLTSIALHVGAGYGGDPEWSHGQWRGRGWSEGRVYELTDPAVQGRIPFGVIDHAARATCDGQEGWGLFEHASLGRHDPSGFADYGSVAP
jgi:hypothetical protein